MKPLTLVRIVSLPLVGALIAVAADTPTNSPRPRSKSEASSTLPPMGPVAINAKWKEFSPYITRMIDTIQVRWERTLADGNIYPPSGSFVTVKFVLNAEGKVSKVLSVDPSSTEAGAKACVDSITSSTYGEWTPAMTASLGRQQEMTFRFQYR